MTLGEIINQYRLEHKISMDVFSKQSGLTKGYISMLEKNEHPKSKKPIIPTEETLLKVARGMNVPVDYILNKLDPNQEIQINVSPERLGNLPQQAMTDSVELIPSTVKKITATASRLEHKRQLIVLNTAEKQLEEQKQLEQQKANKPQKGIVSELFEQRRKEQLAEEEKGEYAIEGTTASAAASGLGRGYGYDDSDTYTVYTDEKPPKPYSFATMVKGDSMMPEFKDGDMLYLHDKGISSYSGMLAVVAYGDRTYFKKIYTEDDTLRLVSLNEKYDDILLEFPPSEDTHIKIFEVVGSFTPIEM